MFTLAEIVGAVLGYGLLRFLSPEDLFTSANGICMTLPHETVSMTKAFFIEFFLTCGLAAFICGVWDPRNKKYADSAPLRIGLVISALSIAGGPYTGASMNPVRSFAPAFWNGDWDHHWIYWVAPVAAALVTSLLYKFIFWRGLPQDDKHEQEPLADNERKSDLEL